ncbi:MAG: SPOR domain-containing protein [Acidobacteria bacterium]|jgi:cell division septation protein DedD|nr:SPOR domain-containing protein [Candidatus Sulfomarinibacter sp. MAG AM1]
MSRSYYVIELSARWLTVLLIALALVMVIAFALGYGAAWSVLTAEETTGEMTALQAAATLTEIPEVVIPDSVSTPAAEPTETPPPSPTATPSPEPTKPPTPQPTPTAAVTEFFVQVLASAKQQSVDAAQARLEDLGFASDHQHLITVQDAGAGVLFKLRIGPFPDRGSADRVAQRMSSAGFPDAWVVAP